MTTTPKLQIPKATELNLSIGSSLDSMAWLKAKIRSMPSMKYSDKRFMLGRMYMFRYVPASRYELPYYDRFPLVLLLSRDNNGFMGLNMHYLPPRMRYIFLNKLMRYAALTPENEVYRLKVSYEILKMTSRLREYKPALKRYSYDQLRTIIIPILSTEWQNVLNLPLEGFVKQKKTTVWQESVDSIKEAQENGI